MKRRKMMRGRREGKEKENESKKCNGVNLWSNDIDFHESQQMTMIIVMMMMKIDDE